MTIISSEYQLQGLITEKPDKYLPGHLINPSAPRKWLLISTELWVEVGNVDLFFLDQDAIPTLVECKLYKNPESKGGIVWQLISYLAYARHCLTADYLYQSAIWTYNCSKKELLSKLNHIGVFKDGIQDENNMHRFFEVAEYNIHNAKARLIFYVDKTPYHLPLIIHELRELISNQKTELFLIDWNNDNPILRDIKLRDIPLHEKPPYEHCIEFREELEKLGQETLFEEILEMCHEMGFSVKCQSKSWITFKKDNRVVFYMCIENNSLIFQEYSTQKKYNVNHTTLEGIKDKIKNII